MNIHLVDLQAQMRALRGEIDAAIKEVLDGCGFILGQTVAGFEEALARAAGAAHAIGVNSGTDALLLALKALRRERGGGEVITTPFTFFATAEAILHAGLDLRFADIERDSFNLDPVAVRAAVDSNTVAVLPVHLYGACADMDAFAALDLGVVEDAAQAIGATYKEHRAGSLGHAAAFSFYPTKNLGAAGDAGAVTTNDDALAARVRSLRAHGEVRAEGSRSYRYEEIGYNSRLDALQAAILSVKLRHLESWQARRNENAAYYGEALGGLSGVVPPPPARFGEHVYHQYVIRAERRDALAAHLAAEGVGTRTFYPEPLHLTPALRHLGLGAGAFPEAEAAASEVLSIPVHEHLSESQREHIASAVRAFYLGK